MKKLIWQVGEKRAILDTDGGRIIVEQQKLDALDQPYWSYQHTIWQRDDEYENNGLAYSMLVSMSCLIEQQAKEIMELRERVGALPDETFIPYAERTKPEVFNPVETSLAHVDHLC